MSKKNNVLTAAAIALLVLGGATGFYFINKENKLNEKNKNIELINSYVASNDFESALNLLKAVQTDYSEDSDVIELASYVAEQRNLYQQKIEEFQKFSSDVFNESELIYTDNIIDEFIRLKNELLKLDPESSVVKEVMSRIEEEKEVLTENLTILLNSLSNAKTTKEEDSLKKLIYNLLDSAENDFKREQITDSLKFIDNILAINSDNPLANSLEDDLKKREAELKTAEELAAIKKKMDNLLAQAEAELEKNNFDEAESLRKQILDLDPENRDALSLKDKIDKKIEEKKLQDEIDSIMEEALSAFNSNLLDRAEELREDILELDPNNQQALLLKNRIDNKRDENFNNQLNEIVNKAKDAINKAQLDYARDLVQDVAKLDKNSPKIDELNKLIKAKEIALQDAKERERLEKINNLVKEASLKFNNQEMLESEDLYSQVLVLDTNNIDALKGLADISIFNAKDDPSEISRAVRRINRVLSSEPNNLDYLKTLADLHDRSGDYAKEIEAINKILQKEPTAEFYVKAGIASFRLAKYNASTGYFDSAITLDANYSEVYYPYALTYEKLDDNSKRGEMLAKSSTLRPNHAATQYELGRYYTDLEDYGKALGLFLKASSINPNSSKYKMGVALAYYNLEEYNKSIEIYENILETDKTLSEVYYNLSLARMAIEEYTEALSDISLAIKINPKSPTYIYTVGQISEALGNTDNAINYYLTAIKMDNSYYKPMLNLGNIYDGFGRYADGLTILKMAYALKPTDMDVVFSLGTSYLHNKLYDDSLSLLEEAYNSDKESLLKLYTLSLAYTEVGENEKAEEGFKEVLSKDENYYDAYFYLGQLLYSIDRQDEAKAYFNRVLELNPEYQFKDKIAEFLL